MKSAIFRSILVAVIIVMAVLPAGARKKKSTSAAASKKEFVVVIDAGHGGSDKGASGPTADEKDINLKVADKVAARLEKKMKNVQVVRTRTSDRYVSLADRCRKANNAGADLFVSIHCDSSEGVTTVEGATVYVPQHKNDLSTASQSGSEAKDPEQDANASGPASRDAAKMIAASSRAGSLIMDRLTADAGRTRRGVRKRDFFVLRFTQMPAVLVELDFICNEKQEKYLKSDKGQDALADAIVSGVHNYLKNATPHAVAPSSSKEAPADTAPRAKATAKSADSNAPVLYKVQFLTSPRLLPEGSAKFRNLSPVDYYKDNGTYKYTVGETRTVGEANKILREVKKLFPDAFVITTRGGVRIK